MESALEELAALPAQRNLIDGVIARLTGPDYYLVLAGPRGAASSVRASEWLSSMVYPDPLSPLLQLTATRREQLMLFAPRG